MIAEFESNQNNYRLIIVKMIYGSSLDPHYIFEGMKGNSNEVKSYIYAEYHIPHADGMFWK
jgi:hypothetical protein